MALATILNKKIAGLAFKGRKFANMHEKFPILLYVGDFGGES
jgi:hypothetical protein